LQQPVSEQSAKAAVGRSIFASEAKNPFFIEQIAGSSLQSALPAFKKPSETKGF